jgi:hypothetical protein
MALGIRYSRAATRSGICQATAKAQYAAATFVPEAFWCAQGLAAGVRKVWLPGRRGTFLTVGHLTSSEELLRIFGWRGVWQKIV